jgi:magnesium-transporting ATPase (P-type)
MLLALDKLYVWTDHAKVEADHLLHHKAPYLNTMAFVARFAVVMAIFTLYAFLLSRKSEQQDREGDGGRAYRMQQISAVGLLVFVIATSFVGFDWVMSLDPYWFSSLYGAIFLSGSAVAALTFLILVANFLVQRQPMTAVFSPKRFHDFGTLLFAFVMFFTYLTLSQFIIAYQGNLPEEVVWFEDRFHALWGFVAFGLLGLHFFFPFLVLLHRR